MAERSVPIRRYEPTTAEVQTLIDRAASTPDGTELLQHGALDAVSAMFKVHAFVVDAARDRLAAEATDPPIVSVPAGSPAIV